MKIRANNAKLIKIWNNGPMKPNRWKYTNNRQLNTKQPSRCAWKDNGIRENNESSLSVVGLVW